MVDAAIKARSGIPLRKSLSWQNGPLEGCFDRWAQKVKQQRSRNTEANTASQEITPKEIDQIAQNLGRNNRYGQSPPPKATFEPTRPSKCQRCAQQQKEDSRWFAKSRKLFMGCRIENPHPVEECALPTQCRPGQRCHCGAEKQENANRS
jgi:hypothetical protein